MTNRSVDEYLSLVTSEHRLKPKFIDTVSLSVSLFSALQSVMASMPEKFDVDLAVGVQLDAVGEWVGVSRNIDTPLSGVYFSWDSTVSDGWEGGVWKGEFDPDSGLTSLSDDSYRVLIKAKIAANSWDGSVQGAYDVWTGVFTDSYIIIQDNQDMSMIVGIAGTRLDTVTQALLTGGYIPLKPEGVKVSYYAVSPEDGPLFVWDSDSAALAGWDLGNWAIELQPT